MTEIIIKEKEIKNMNEIREKQVMLDSDLARLYGTLTGNINRAVKRNPKHFPKNFYFKLSEDEYASLLCQNGIAKNKGGRQNIILCIHRTRSCYAICSFKDRKSGWS